MYGFAEVEILRRDEAPEILPVDAAVAIYPEEAETLTRLSTSHRHLNGIDLSPVSYTHLTLPTKRIV